MLTPITSPQNPRVKNASRLRESRIRRRDGLFLVDGLREVQRAWSSSFEITEIFLNAGLNASSARQLTLESVVLASGVASDRMDSTIGFLREAESSGVPIIPLAKTVFERICYGERDEGLIAVVREKTFNLQNIERILAQRRIERGDEPFIATIEGVEKPGNFGAILRSADGAGVDALIVAGSSYDVFNPNAIRASLGAIFHIPIVVAEAEEVLIWLRKNRIQRVTALCDESVSYLQIDYSRPTSIILGSEAHGLTALWSDQTAEDVEFDLLKKTRLPMLGVADSLNVSTAAAVFFYETRRFRSQSDRF